MWPFGRSAPRKVIHQEQRDSVETNRLYKPKDMTERMTVPGQRREEGISKRREGFERMKSRGTQRDEQQSQRLRGREVVEMEGPMTGHNNNNNQRANTSKNPTRAMVGRAQDAIPNPRRPSDVLCRVQLYANRALCFCTYVLRSF